MTDSEIVQLYLLRDEKAIRETESKYGTLIFHTSFQLLNSREDALECTNDTYHQAWKSIPPQQPQSLNAYLRRIVRNLSISRWRQQHAQKRACEINYLLSELEDCIPDSSTVDDYMDQQIMCQALNQWLLSLPEKERLLFMRRYWHGDSVKKLSLQFGKTPNQLASLLFRLRQQLRCHLEKEEIQV